jgi:excisionase family DNA binding protein
MPSGSSEPGPASATVGRALANALDVNGVAELLGESAETIRELVRRGELVTVRVGGRWRLPAWQFGPEGRLHGLRDILERWPGSFISLSIWACTPSAELRGRTPGEALRDGDLPDVTALLRGRTRGSR